MEVNIEKILPLVIQLSKRYTSNESSSITYRTAEMLMEAVLYSQGKKCIQEKLAMIKQIYEVIVSDFDDYGCLIRMVFLDAICSC